MLISKSQNIRISGSTLKLLATTSMIVDHLAHFIYWDNEEFQKELYTIGNLEITSYFLMRAFGRLAFPIFAFLIVEGFFHTKNHFKYGRNLLLFALISEIPWNLAHEGAWHYPTQNVFFTLFLGYLGVCCLAYLKEETTKKVAALLLLLGFSFILRADYGYRGFAFILMLYALRNQKLLKSVLGCCMLSSACIAGLAFIPINLYNGNRGFIKGLVWKLCFYAFYPVHLMLLYILSN